MTDELSISGLPGILIVATGVTWSALVAMVRRSVNAMEKKMDENEAEVASLKREMSAMTGDARYEMERRFNDLGDEMRRELEKRRIEDERKMEAIRRGSVTRHEFTLSTLSTRSQIETIYKKIIQDGAND